MKDRQHDFIELQETLKINCEQCSGLCCVALYCMKTDGFPADKEAGVPCKHLMGNFRCDIHSNLINKNMKGCLAYDCFGAGQKVTQKYDSGETWVTDAKKAKEIFAVFLVVFQLHQMAWYLIESLHLITEHRLKEEVRALILENEQITSQSPDMISHVNIEEYRAKVTPVLKHINALITPDSFGKNHTGNYLGKKFKGANHDFADFSMSLLIAADLEGCSLRHTNFLGADLRDANIKNTDLSTCIFLTQMQINSAKGNGHTKLPGNLLRPGSWEE